jgi:hypothetical protein
MSANTFMNIAFTCANTDCHMSLLDLKPTNLVDTPPSVGDILLCGGCGSINIVTLLGCGLMSDEDFKNLAEDERKDLDFARRAVVRQLRQS